MIRRLMRVLGREPRSKSIAKSRLQLILVQDRLGVDEDIMKHLQVELTELLSRYFEIKPENVEVDLHREAETMALVANIPVLGLKTRHPLRA